MEWLVQLHSIWRYAVLIAALGAILLALLALTGTRPWDSLAERFSFFYPLSMDIQVVIGLGVWLFAEWDRNDNLLRWIHPALMLIAVGLAHAGRVNSERATEARDKGRRATIFFVASLVLVLVAIPLASWPV